MGDAAAYRHWTDAELELLADRSLAAAEVARSRRGICRVRWTADEIGRLRDYAASPKQIAAETGHSLSAVYAKRSEMGLPSPAAMRMAAREAAAATAGRATSGKISLRP